jgi:NAD-dependent deacetylase
VNPAHLVEFHPDGSVDGDPAPVVEALREEHPVVALTGAGISVESGIPDFRSPGGLWARFDPYEYASLSCFIDRPEKAWELYRELGGTVRGKLPNPAHEALARLERAGLLSGVVTQNVDGLHQAAGSRQVLEIHGDHSHLQCLQCGRLEPFEPHHLEPGPVPRCETCGFPLKPNVVLFEEPVRDMGRILALVRDCRLLLVVGTSAEVVPASALPGEVLRRGGSLLEFNLEPTQLTLEGLGPRGALVRGPVGTTLPAVVAPVLALPG